MSKIRLWSSGWPQGGLKAKVDRLYADSELLSSPEAGPGEGLQGLKS